MLDHFVSTSSVSCQSLVLESPLFQVIFMKNYAENPLFDGHVTIIRDHSFFKNLLFSGIDFFCPYPFNKPKIIPKEEELIQVNEKIHTNRISEL